MEFITWLNSNSGAIIAFATVVLTVITWRYVRLTKDYVRLTRQALEENRQMRIDAQKPKIAIYLDSYTDHKTHVDLYVENIGPGPAYEVKFITDPSRIMVGYNMSLQESPFIRMGIGYFAPGKKRKHKIGVEDQLDVAGYKDKPPKITVTYKDRMGNEQEPEEFYLKFSEHIGR